MKGFLRNHHAYLISGREAETFETLKEFLVKEFDLETVSNPGFRYFKKENWGIEDSQGLLEEARLMPSGKGPKVFIMSFARATREAQNTLLKIFEEPPEDTYFFILKENTSRILPTLLSRMLVIQSGSGTFKPGKIFLSLSIPERLALVKELIDSEEDERISQALDFISGLEKEVAVLLRQNPSFENAEAASSVLLARRYATQSGPSLKYLLEGLSLRLPSVLNLLR